MTKEEIKGRYSMRDVLARYGMAPNRSGFIHCPFHSGDHQPSLKVYEKDFHCFSCGANGDIFTFVQMLEQVPFREAFCILGGDYGKPSFSTRLHVYQAQKQRQMQKKEQGRLRKKQELNNILIAVYRKWIARMEPLSDGWCDCCNALQYQLYLHEYLHEKPGGKSYETT